MENGKWKMGASTKGLCAPLKVFLIYVCVLEKQVRMYDTEEIGKNQGLYYSEADITLPMVSWLTGFL